VGALVKFSGFAADVAGVLRDVDILVHPADGESFGRVVVEAMAAGVPVVGVRGGGVAELVRDGETGFLVPPDDAQALAQAVKRLAQDAALAEQMGARGRAHAFAEYSIEATARQLAQMYARAVLPRGGGGG
jgi:glycosyltransferase involved in cell wall biosynthesis